MALPDVLVNILDNTLGVSPGTAANVDTTLGVCSNGVPNTLYSFGDAATMQSTLGQGQLVEALAHKMAIAPGTHYAMPINPSAFGFTGTVTHVGTSATTVAAALSSAVVITVRCVLGGTLGTAQFTFQLGSGATSAPVTSAGSWSSTGYLVPGTLTVLVFASGTYVGSGTPDIYTTSTTATAVTHTQGAGPAVTQQSSPLDQYQVLITIVAAGALGTGTFQYSLDNGNTQSQVTTVPGSGIYAIPNTGIFITFSAAVTAAETYSFNAVSAGFANADVTTALTALAALPNQWFNAQIVGTPATAAAAASLVSTVDTQMVAMETAYRFAMAMTECPTVGSVVVSGSAAIADIADTDTVITTAFVNTVSKRTAVGAGDCDLVSPITGRIVRRNAAWVVGARLSLIPPSQEAMWVGRGSLAGVRKLYRDERATPALDVARFCTLRTFTAFTGFYITNAWTMATPGSDFMHVVNRRVMDIACTIARSASLQFVGNGVRVNTSTGFILENDAQAIESYITALLNANVVNTTPPGASAASVVLSRSTNLISNGGNEPMQVRITPLGYLYFLTENIGFFNPATATT
jgi:hypothetical protein